MTHASFPYPAFQFQILDMQFVHFPEDFPKFLYEDPIDPDLSDQLQHLGQLHPVLVQQLPDHQYHVLGRYPYFSALKVVGAKNIACQILPYTMPAALVFSWRILHDPHSGESPILQAYLLQQAQSTLPEEEVLPLLALMGHKPQYYKLKELTGLLELDPSAILALHHGILTQKTGKLLSRLHREDQHHIINLIRTYRIGGSKQQKIVEMITELCLRYNKPVRDIVKNWLPDRSRKDVNMPQQLQSLLQYLYEQCYPGKTAAEKKFKELIQKLQPPEGVVIAPSPSYEDESVELRLKFCEIAALTKKWVEINKIMQ